MEAFQQIINCISIRATSKTGRHPQNNEIQRNPRISHTKIQNPQTNPHNSIEILFMQNSATPNKKGKHTNTSENSKNLNTTHSGMISTSLPHSGGISFAVDRLSQPRKSQ